MDGTRDLARFFKALGDETRLGLVSLLAQQEPGSALCVGRLAQELEVTPSAVSQHLRVLKDLGLVHAERRGYHLHYFLDQARLATYQALVRQQLGIELVPDSQARQQEGAEPMCCHDRDRCTCPEKANPEECTPEQIRQCHGDVTEHPCGQEPTEPTPD
jgi:ArsR family transcriptional regulator